MPYFILPKGETTTRINFAPAMLANPDCGYYSAAGRWRDAEGYSDRMCNSCGIGVAVCGESLMLLSFYQYFCKPCALEGMDWQKRREADPAAAPPASLLAYPTRALAALSLNAKTHEIVFRPSVDDLTRWREREEQRFGSGEYAHVPWHYRDQYSAVHYAHMSVDKPGYIAFTRDTEAGVLDKQTRMRPGRYLQEFYAEHFTATEIAEYVAKCAAFETATFSLATTPQQITDIYSGSGPSSCMVIKPQPEYKWQKAFEADVLPEHPCAVYGGGDLALAYVGTIGAISQRAFVWPTKHIHGRIYGTGPLAHLLKRSGYTEGSFKGARLRAVTVADGYIAPYVDRFCAPGDYAADSADYVKDASGKWLVLRGDNNGDIQLDHTNGYSGDDDLVSDSDSTFECANCGNDYDDDTSYGGNNGSLYCESCFHDLFATCDCCDNTVDLDSTSAVANGQTWCASCVERHTVECRRCDETWIEGALSPTLQRHRRERGVTDYCESCASELIDCASCGSWFDPDDHEACPCGAVARCPDTAALPFTEWANVYHYGDTSYRLDAETFANDPHARFELWRKYRADNVREDVTSTQRQRGNGQVTCAIYDQGSDYSGRYTAVHNVCAQLRREYGSTCLYQIVYIVPPVATATLPEVSAHATL